MNTLAFWAHCARPKTLMASVSPVVLASGIAASEGGFRPAVAAGCLGFAVCAQVAANFANDAFDGARGADAPDRIGPARGVATGRISARAMAAAALGALGLAALCGLAALAAAYPAANPLVLLGLGAACLAGAPFYSRAAYAGWGDVLVVAYFGVAAVCGCVYAQTGAAGATALGFALCAGVLCDNILLVNNTRDAEDDARSGKRTTVVRFGKATARAQFFAALFLGAVACPIALSATRGIYWLVLAALAPFAWRLARRFARARAADDWNFLLAGSSKFLFFWSVLCAACLAWGGR